MGTQTKIVVLKAKELIYTCIFLLLGIVLAVIIINMFSKNKHPETKETSGYIPGVYSSTITLGENTLNVSVTVDKDSIKHVNVENLNETVTTMYPLLEPALKEINDQISTTDNIDTMEYSSENQYTYILLNEAIKNALSQAKTNVKNK